MVSQYVFSPLHTNKIWLSSTQRPVQIIESNHCTTIFYRRWWTLSNWKKWIIIICFVILCSWSLGVGIQFSCSLAQHTQTSEISHKSEKTSLRSSLVSAFWIWRFSFQEDMWAISQAILVDDYNKIASKKAKNAGDCSNEKKIIEICREFRVKIHRQYNLIPEHMCSMQKIRHNMKLRTLRYLLNLTPLKKLGFRINHEHIETS